MFYNYEKALGIDPQHFDNQFVSTFYNKFPKGASEEQKKLLKDHVPKFIRVTPAFRNDHKGQDKDKEKKDDRKPEDKPKDGGQQEGGAGNQPQD